MSCGKSEKIENLNDKLDQLLKAHELIEQSAFDTINENDKLLTILRETMGRVQEMLDGLDMMNSEIAAQLETLQAADNLTPVRRLYEISENSSKATEELARLLQAVMSEAEQGSKVIHRMEEEIALAQDAVTAVYNAAFSS